MSWISGALGSALITALLLGAVCGLLGTFVVARRMALTGDMLSHAVLPGIVAGLAWSESRNPLIVLASAAVAGFLGSWAHAAILRSTRLKPDAALAIVLSVFFAVGIAMISRLQPAGVQAFLFGQVAAIDRRDLQLLLGVTIFTLVLVPLAFRVLTLIAFDPPFAKLLGLPVRLLDAAFYLLLTAVIVIAMQAVGVILVTAMLVTPAAAARFFTHSLKLSAGLACLFGAIGGMAGVLLSASRGGLSTGPLMALSVTAIFILSALTGPRLGWIPTTIRKRRAGNRILREDLLKGLWMREESGDPSPPSTPLPGGMKSLLRRGLVECESGALRLTTPGRGKAARLVRRHRLWERYLTDRAAYQPDHVHDEAEKAEHWIDDETLDEIADKLGHPTTDPHGSPIPPQENKEVRP